MPRPRRFEERATVVISIRVTPAQQDDLRQVARENHVKLADVIRDAVNSYVADYREAPAFCSALETK